ncbi:cyclin-F-like [Anneissia japonica]|uniref:cyclin-F-like n=1 Tax=Anneissia japonica TaxID=1529436 RepID=UPI001425AF54|nr:cyclin-F-like [Anneissia japonica]
MKESKRRIPLRQQRLCCRQQGILSLPDELLLLIFKGVACKDLLKIRQVHPRFKELVDATPSLWKNASFVAEWPSTNNLNLFERAAKQGNIEALIKLGVAYLYYEGAVTDSGRKDTEYNGQMAAKYFRKAEICSNVASTFMWLFIRPPWNTNGACCKACVLNSMQSSCRNNKSNDPSVLMCIAKTYSLSEEEEMEKNAKMWLEKAYQAGSHDAAYLLWKNSQSIPGSVINNDLHSIRKLREIASSRCLDAKLELYSAYCKGFYGGLSSQQVTSTLRQFFQSSIPTNNQNLYRVQKCLNNEMRYILVDWLVEVTGMKDYSSLTLHTTISCIDRYLMSRKITRADLQLVGIAGMVVCARLLENDIITIREAAWLTDGTYQYEDVVRMLGDIVATLHGNLRVLTIVDYLNLLCLLVSADKKIKDMALYICEISLLHSDFGPAPPAKIASCALYLARIIFNAEYPWSSTMTLSTGFDISDLEETTLKMHRKCFSESPLTDHREVTLVAVKQRYASKELSSVSSIECMPYAVLCDLLGVESRTSTVVSHSKLPAIESFLMSPSSKKRPADINDEEGGSRPRPVTPTAVLGMQNNAANMDNNPNDSFCSINSGYEGDEESEGEFDSFVYEEFALLNENKQSSERIRMEFNLQSKNCNLPSTDVKPCVSVLCNSPSKVCAKEPKANHSKVIVRDPNCNYESTTCTKKRKSRGRSFTIGGGGKLGMRRSRPALLSVHKRVYHLRNSSHQLVEPESGPSNVNRKSMQHLRM